MNEATRGADGQWSFAPGEVIHIAVALILDASGRMLVVRKHGSTAFMQPGGKLEAGESAADALVRELGEELALQIDRAALQPCGTFSEAALNEAGCTVRADAFVIEASQDGPLVQLSPHAELEEVRWIELSDPSRPCPVALAPLTEHQLMPVAARYHRTMTSSPNFKQQWQTWHDGVERRRADPHGFLAVTGMTWLTAEPAGVPGIIGQWSLENGRVFVRLGEGEVLTTQEEIDITGTYVLPVLQTEESRLFDDGDIRIEVAQRGPGVIVRPRDPHAPLLTNYTGTPAFEPDETWAVEGTFTPAAQQIEHGTVVGYDVTEQAAGTIDFQIAGHPQQVVVYPADEGRLSLVFRDATAGVTTVATGRGLTIDAPGDDGATTLDFNRATNFPCAYSEAATCPLPPAQNVLKVSIPAGEKLPGSEPPMPAAETPAATAPTVDQPFSKQPGRHARTAAPSGGEQGAAEGVEKNAAAPVQVASPFSNPQEAVAVSDPVEAPATVAQALIDPFKLPQGEE